MAVSGHDLVVVLDGYTARVEIVCGYEPTDPTRPCAMFRDFDTDEPVDLETECGVAHWVEAVGWEDALRIGTEIRTRPVPIDVESIDGVGYDVAAQVEPRDGA